MAEKDAPQYPPKIKSDLTPNQQAIKAELHPDGTRDSYGFHNVDALVVDAANTANDGKEKKSKLYDPTRFQALARAALFGNEEGGVGPSPEQAEVPAPEAPAPTDAGPAGPAA